MNAGKPIHAVIHAREPMLAPIRDAGDRDAEKTSGDGLTDRGRGSRKRTVSGARMGAQDAARICEEEEIKSCGFMKKSYSIR